MRNGNRGFTLVEVAVALAVVALALTALLIAMGRQADATVHLRDKLVAHWVALNRTELARLEHRHSGLLPLEEAGATVLAGRTWYWRAQRVPTASETAVQWRVDVSDRAEREAPVLASLATIFFDAPQPQPQPQP